MSGLPNFIGWIVRSKLQTYEILSVDENRIPHISKISGKKMVNL